MPVIANVVAPGSLEITQLAKQVEKNLLTHFIKCISSISQNVLKHFSGTAIFT